MGGHEVIVTYAHDSDAAEAAEREAQARGLSIRAVRCDVASEADWQRLFCRGTALGEKGVNVLVHAAGVVRDRLLMMMPETDFDAVVGTHLKGGFLAAKAAMRGMIGARWGRMIFITSPTATLGRPGQASYGAAKAGLSGMMHSLIWEVSRFQITVNCVCAGLVETSLSAGLSDKARAELLGAIPLCRVGRVDEIAAAVAWLASDRAAYITGQTLSVDGGLSR